ncbi:MAG: DUF58 domain-containing protein [Lachnospiraceae bacterium]|nr:DUF58 domain-containing protein [Lachnospiraceae bacterium]
MIQLIGIGLIAFFLFVLQKYIYKKLWNKQLTADITFATNSIFQGQEGQLKEIIENRKRLPISMLKVKFQTSRHLKFEDTKGSRTTDQYYRNDVFQINGGEKITRTLTFTGSKRGYYTIDSMDMVASDLFMTSLFVETLPVHTTLYVYPKPYCSEEFSLSLQQLNGEVLTKRHLLKDPFEYRGIREYQPTDDMRSINWKASAKTGDFKVNQKNYTSLKAIRIFMNLEDDNLLKKEECVEASIQIAAGLCRYFLSQGIMVACYGNGVDVINHLPMMVEASAGNGQMEAINCALARVDTDSPVVDFNSCFARRVTEEAKGTMTCFVTPNIYPPFAKLLEQYHTAGNDYMIFYPTNENKNPEIPGFLQNRTRFLHLREI